MAAVEELITNHLGLWTAAIKRKSAAGRASSNEVELYGIKKLRELILELGVRGLLVPQDPSDEPASELLKKITAEKAKLVKEGKMKKDKPLPPISEEEKLFDLPDGWLLVRFGDLLINRDSERIPLSVDERSPRRGDYDYYGASGVIDSIDAYLFDKPLLLIGEDGANLINRSTPIAFMAYGKYWVNNHAHVLDGYSKELLLYVCLHINAISLESYVTGTAQPKMNQAKMNGITLAIPPLAEQHRIIAKVDELLALCDQLEQQTDASLSAHRTLVETLLNALTSAADHASFASAWKRIAERVDTLFATEESIDQLKQTILQLAVMGKLVPQDPNDEPASELLKRMAAEKAKRVKEGLITKEKPLPPIGESEKPFGLPEKWEWARISSISELITSGSRDWAQYLSKDGAIFVTMGNLSKGSYALRLDNLRFVNPPKNGEGNRTRLEASDLLISITGEVGNLGRIPEDFGEAYINQHTCLVRFLPSCRGRYFPEVLRSPLASSQFNEPQRGVKNSFRLSDVDAIVVPLPPLAEQHRIVAKVDELMALCDQLKSRFGDAQTTQLHLANAMAEKALARS
jgi:type I restriction enzyme, S subunit